jgi:hypothetical protein
LDHIIRHMTELKLHNNMNSEEKPLIHSLKEWTKPPHKDTKHHYDPQNFLTMMQSNNDNNIMVPPGSPLPYLLYWLLPSQSLQIVISNNSSSIFLFASYCSCFFLPFAPPMSYMLLHQHHLSPALNVSLVNYSEEGGSNTIRNPDKLPINTVSNTRQTQSCINCLLLMVCSS